MLGTCVSTARAGPGIEVARHDGATTYSVKEADQTCRGIEVSGGRSVTTALA